jgi:peptidyl-prolyl cis-trans isomerase SDCCAG10
MCCMQVTGDSIFNLLTLADIETDKDDRPVYEQKILSIEVFFPCHHVF